MIGCGRSLRLEDGRGSATRNEWTGVGVHMNHAAGYATAWCHLVLYLGELVTERGKAGSVSFMYR